MVPMYLLEQLLNHSIHRRSLSNSKSQFPRRCFVLKWETLSIHPDIQWLLIGICQEFSTSFDLHFKQVTFVAGSKTQGLKLRIKVSTLLVSFFLTPAQLNILTLTLFPE